MRKRDVAVTIAALTIGGAWFAGTLIIIGAKIVKRRLCPSS